MVGIGRSWLVGTWFLIGSALLSGCFFYDSSWGAAKASQKRVAAQRMPSELKHDPPPRTTQRFRMRAYATPHYAAALVDGEAQFRQAIADANPTLASALSFQLELTDYRVWSNGRSDDDLKALLATIEQQDPAQDVDWVVILASPRHMVATSADQLGMAPLFGRHLAIRAMSDVAEFDVIERGFTELSEDEKRKLYASRKRHKAATVLLHELGHTLGMPHELDRHSMMSPVYDLKSSDFSSVAAQLGRRALDLRATAFGSALHRQAAQSALDALHGAPPHTFEEHTAQEVEELLRRHRQAPITEAPAPVAAQPTPAMTKPVHPWDSAPAPSETAASPPASNGLSAADHAVFLEAKQAHAGGDKKRARVLAAPLFTRYPKNLAVQELRCQLAMGAGLAMDVESAECEPLMRLSGSGL